jgi:hypothetical protein
MRISHLLEHLAEELAAVVVVWILVKLEVAGIAQQSPEFWG